MSDGKLSRKTRQTAHWIKSISLLALALVVLVLVAQNTDVVTVRLLVWEVSMSLVVLLPGTILIGFAAGYVFGRLGRARGGGPPEDAP